MLKDRQHFPSKPASTAPRALFGKSCLALPVRSYTNGDHVIPQARILKGRSKPSRTFLPLKFLDALHMKSI